MLGGVVAMSSTVLIVQQLTERAELNRTHGRLAFSVVLFQDIAVVPFLALAAALAPGSEAFSIGGALSLVARRHGGGARGAGRRPLAAASAAVRDRQQPPARVVHARRAAGGAGVGLGFADSPGFSMALGAFLAGMMLAETEYSHQVESVIRPFRDILLGLFFISVGMLLDFHALWRELWLILALLVAMVLHQGDHRHLRHAPVRRLQLQGAFAPASRSRSAANSASRCSRCCCRTRPSIRPSRSRCWSPWCWAWCWRR